MMKAVVQRGYGVPERVLHLEDVAEPVPGEGQVLVRVHAAGVNAADRHVVTGVPTVMRLAWRDPRGLRREPGSDLAGTVERVGPGVTRFGVGDLVVGAGRSTFAELALTREQNLLRVPEGIDAVTAAALPMAGVTAWQGLHRHRPPRPGDRVLVTGAAGGVGHLAVQLAKALGCHVTATGSTRNLDLLREAGAAEVLDYTVDDVPPRDLPDADRFDLVLHVAGATPVGRFRRVLRRDGALVVVNGEGGRTAGPLPLLARMAVLNAVVPQTLRFLAAEHRVDDLAEVLALVAAGRVTPHVERTFDLADTAAAVEHLRSGHPRGKSVVTVSSA